MEEFIDVINDNATANWAPLDGLIEVTISPSVSLKEILNFSSINTDSYLFLVPSPL